MSNVIITDEARERFDALFEEALDSLPEQLHSLMDEVPVILEDHPPPDVLDYFEEVEGHRPELDELCGLHTGIPLTQGGHGATGDLPSQVVLFRVGIIAAAGGWEERPAEDDEDPDATVGGEDLIYEEIVITLLHEIGHELGLEEEDLEKLGYG
jgi:predicted Zn-dependent protease with MMP-like domain